MGYKAGMPEAYIIAEDKRAPQHASQRTPLARSQKGGRRDETRVERERKGKLKRQAKRRKIFSQRTAYNVDGDDDDRVLLFNLTHTLPQPLFSVSRAVLIDLSDS